MYLCIFVANRKTNGYVIIDYIGDDYLVLIHFVDRHKGLVNVYKYINLPTWYRGCTYYYTHIIQYRYIPIHTYSYILTLIRARVCSSLPLERCKANQFVFKLCIGIRVNQTRNIYIVLFYTCLTLTHAFISHITYTSFI